MNEKELAAVEVCWWYDWISHYVDEEGNKFSRIARLPMEKDELCLHWKIYKVEQTGDYSFRVLSERDDK